MNFAPLLFAGLIFLFGNIITVQENLQNKQFSIKKTDEKILIDLLFNVLEDCTTVIAHDKNYLSNELFSDLNSAKSGHFLFDVDKILQDNFQAKLNLKNGFIDLHKIRPQCSAVWISLNGNKAPNVQKASYIIAKLENIASVNKDYFVFHMDLNSLTTLFLSPQNSQEIKYKLGVTTSSDEYIENHHSHPPQILTACIYCNNGFPKLIKMQLTIIPQKTDVFPNYLTNFYGKRLRISTPTECKWLTEIRLENGIWTPKRGIYNLVILEIMKRLNFSLDFFPSTGWGGTGFRFPNGTWIGVVGDLLSKNAELGQAAGQTFSRNSVIDYSFPITYEWLTFTTGEPQRFYSWRAVYRPLSIGVWTFLFVSGAFMTVMFVLFLKAIESSRHPKYSQTIGMKRVSIIMLKSLVEQGDDTLLSPSFSATFKILSLFWLLYVLVLITAYKSKLVGFLAFPDVEVPPDTFEALAKSTSYKILLQYTGAAFNLFKSSVNPTYVKIFEKMKIEKSDVKCFEEAIHSKSGCISWANIVDYVVFKNLSDAHGRAPLVKAPAATYFLTGGILMRKRAIYREEISHYVKQSVDSGLLEKWKTLDAKFVLKERREWEKVSGKKKNNYAQTTHDALTLKHLSGSFFILATGLCVALCVFGGELYMSWRKNKILLEAGKRNAPDVSMEEFDRNGSRNNIFKRFQ